MDRRGVGHDQLALGGGSDLVEGDPGDDSPCDRRLHFRCGT
jgi:hypothetical protein